MDTAAIIAALRERANKLVSLDTPPNQDLGDVATDIGAGFIPGVGTALSARDFERARREGDGLGMGLSALGMIPVVGGVTKAAGKLSKSDALVDALRSAKRFDLSLVPEGNKLREKNGTPESITDFKNRLAKSIEAMPFGDTAASFAVYIRNFK